MTVYQNFLFNFHSSHTSHSQPVLVIQEGTFALHLTLHFCSHNLRNPIDHTAVLIFTFCASKYYHFTDLYDFLSRKSKLGNSHGYFLFKYIISFYKSIQQTTQMILALLRQLKSRTAKNAHVVHRSHCNLVLHFPVASAEGHKMCTQVTYSCSFTVDGFHLILMWLWRLGVSETVGCTLIKSTGTYCGHLVLKFILKNTTDFQRTTADHLHLSHRT